MARQPSLTWRDGSIGRLGPRLLKWTLLVPLFRLYRRRVSGSLRWRLAESHVGTVLLSVLAISVIGAVATTVAGFIQNPVGQEPATDARWVAESLQELKWTDPASLTDPKTSAVLEAMATGKIGPNLLDDNVNLIARIGKGLANVNSISVVDDESTVIASSEPYLINRSALVIAPTALGVAQSALSGSASTETNSSFNPRVDAITGAYPLTYTTKDLATGEEQTAIVGAVVVDKSSPSLPGGWGLVALALSYVGRIALTIAALVGIPAIPVGIVVGIRRARAISQPVTELADAVGAIAEQNLGVRVRAEGDDEIAILGQRFNQMADRLQESLAREASARTQAERLLAQNRDLVANVSHELRTPVALVRAHIEALAGEPQHLEDYTRIALRETDRLEALVNDLFQLARVESEGMRLEPHVFDAGAAVREAIESLAEPARRDAGISMKVEAGPGNLSCIGDRARLVQVLQNLMRNAIRYTPEGGIILGGAHIDGDQIAITVRDTGLGIPPADVPHIFDRFYRSEQSRNRSHGGAGLGLAIAKQMVEAMGGTIGAESEVGEGTVFTIHLPRASAPVTESNGAAPASVREREPALLPRAKRARAQDVDVRSR